MLTFAIEWCNCETCTLWPWSTFLKVQQFKYLFIWTVRASAKLCGWHLSILTFAIECDFENCTPWLWPTAWRSTIVNCYIWNGESSAKMHRTTFIDLDIYQRLIPLRCFTRNDLNLRFKVKYFELQYLGNSESSETCEMTWCTGHCCNVLVYSSANDH